MMVSCPAVARLQFLRSALRRHYNGTLPPARAQIDGTVIKPLLDAAKPFLRNVKLAPKERQAELKGILREWKYCRRWLREATVRRARILASAKGPSAPYAETDGKIAWKTRTSEAFASSAPKKGQIIVLDAVGPIRPGRKRLGLRTSEALKRKGHSSSRITIVEKSKSAFSKMQSLAKVAGVSLVLDEMLSYIRKAEGDISAVYADFTTSDSKKVKEVLGSLMKRRGTPTKCFGFTITGRSSTFATGADEEKNTLKKWASARGYHEVLGNGDFSQGSVRTVITTKLG